MYFFASQIGWDLEQGIRLNYITLASLAHLKNTYLNSNSNKKCLYN